MLRRFIGVVGIGALGLLGLGAVWLYGMRRKDSIVVRTQRRVNRAVFNPEQMKTAGQPGAYAAIVRHTGRTSGRAYETPVGAVPTQDGFAIALVYGSQTDWLKNVLASGTATVVHDGTAYSTHSPQVVPTATAAHHFPASEQRNLRLFRIEQCLLLRRADAD